ncbi:hypothetical protein EYZ11_002781 [Aspergillus tanneri]|uniref:Uncharacterized protein n=1 Tax=Aspergillus tanneri TaxID=1220188 RepID=A0A4V3UQ57_9EURO|nr:hypothetical protein EYZ11_002781 [Aspergillus tanneri]
MSPVDTNPVTPFPIWVRDIGSELKSAPQTLSSWDNCMAKSYCKWPVIAAIIVGALIVISIIACVPYNQPYNYPPPMQPPVNDAYKTTPAPPVYRGAQVAHFDSPSNHSAGKYNEDALPAMPSWDNAVTRRVEDTDHHQDAMEMEPLNPSNQATHRTPSASRPNGGGYNGVGYHGGDYNDSGHAEGGYDGAGYAAVPPARTGTPSGLHAEPRAHGYASPSPVVGSSSPIHQYDQPYNDYSHGNSWNQTPSVSAPYATQPQYMSTGPAVSVDRPIPYRQPSPGFNKTPVYRGMSPSIPSTPPPPFTSTAAPYEMTADAGRPPSLLQSGRKPAPNSYRDV